MAFVTDLRIPDGDYLFSINTVTRHRFDGVVRHRGMDIMTIKAGHMPLFSRVFFRELFIGPVQCSGFVHRMVIPFLEFLLYIGRGRWDPLPQAMTEIAELWNRLPEKS
jgi:hypothetical protein